MSAQRKSTATVTYIVNKYKVVINRGADQGVKIGDTYLIYAIGPDLIDPETNEPLGPLEIVRGRVIVRHVQEKVSTLETIEFNETPGKRRIIKREGGSGLVGLSLGLSNKEEIEEGPERSQRALGAEIGDLAKLLTSK